MAKECNDVHCAEHGTVRTRGRTFVGTVTAANAAKTATVEWQRLNYIKKFERSMTAHTKLNVHNPDCIKAEVGDLVKISECRPISKTKRFVIIQKLGKNVAYIVKEKEMQEEAAKTASQKKPAVEAKE